MLASAYRVEETNMARRAYHTPATARHPENQQQPNSRFG